jgi:HPt (histidine-containing phosphotransfer) domain-containing protein
MSDFEVRMEALRSRFRGRAGAEAARLEAALTAGDRTELLRASHALAGNAGLFSFTALGKQAEQIEQAIDAGESKDRIEELTMTVITALRTISSIETT